MLSALRCRRAVFWYLSADRIVAAVIARSDREPVLEACAASFSAPVAGTCFAPGVLEVAWVLGCEKERHVAALASSFCHVEQIGDDDAETEAYGRTSRWSRRSRQSDESSANPTGFSAPVRRRGSMVRGATGLRVLASESVVEEAAALFVRSRLKLVALDCEPCALESLSQALGTPDPDDARRQHLCAVSVMPESETAAEALGEDLAVPVGLAIAWFRAGRAL